MIRQKIYWVIVIGLLPFFIACGSDKSKQEKNLDEENNKQNELVVTDLTLGGLQGPIKQVVEKTYAGPNEVLSDQPDYIARNSYHADGNLDETVASTSDNRIVNFKYRYSEDSIIATQLLILGDSIVSRQQFVYLLAPNGARKQMQAYGADGQLLFSSFYSPNDRGQPQLERNEVARKELWREMPCKIEREFGEDGSLELERWFGYDPRAGECRATGTVRHYKNDPQGNPIEEWMVKDETKELGRFFYKYKYDDRGNWREKTRFQNLQGDTTVTQVVLRSFYYY